MIKMIAKKLAVAVCALVALHTTPTLAVENRTENWVRYQDYKINLPVPKDWKVERDLWGMPLTVLGPERNGERAVLSVHQAPYENFKFNLKLIEANQNQYFVGRQEWLDEFDDAKLTSKIPYQKYSGTSNVEGFQIGVRYQLRGKEFEERSIQLVCNDKLYFVKTLYSPSTEPAADRDVLASLVQSFNCAQVTAKDGAYQPSPLQDLDKKIEAELVERWPNQQQIRSASTESKAVMLESVVEFYKNFEEAASEDLYSQNEKNFIDRIKQLMQGISPKAFADGDYDCFFGGWPSKFIKKNGRLTCGSPADTNPDYSQVASACGANQLACNPALFGNGVCISAGTASERAHATLRCEYSFKKSGKSYDELVKDPSFNNALFEQTIAAAETVCSDDHYSSSNYGLCSTLKDKLNLSISGGKKTADENDQNFINRLDAVKPDNYDQAVKATFDNYADFEARCFDDKNQFKPEVDPDMDPVEYDRCLRDLNAIADDMNKVEKLHNQVEDALSETPPEAASNIPPNVNCAGGNCGATPAGSNVDIPANGGSCSKDELARIKAEPCSWKTYLHAFGSAGISVVKSLFANVKAVWELGKGAVQWVGNKISNAWDWCWGTKKVENKSSNAGHQASQTSDSFLSQLKKDPWGTIARLFEAIVNGIKDFIKNDVFCAKWSDWKQTKCLIPGNFSCMSCQTMVNGIGNAAGYVIGEFVPALLTGGAAAGAGKIAELIKVGKASGKFAKLTAEMSAKFPKLAKAAKVSLEAVKDSAKFLKNNKVTKFVTNNKVTRWSGKVAVKVKGKYKIVTAAMKSFKSKIFGGYQKTLAGINRLRQKNFAWKAGIWVAKQPVILTKNIVMLPKTIYKNKIVQKLTSPLRVTPKLKTVQRGVRTVEVASSIPKNLATYGLKFKNWQVDKIQVGASAMRKAQIVGVALPYTKYITGLNQNVITAQKEESKALSNLGSWEQVLPKVSKGTPLTDAEFTAFMNYNHMSRPEALTEMADGKMTLLQQGNKVKFTDEEIKAYSAAKAVEAGVDAETMEASVRQAIQSVQ